MLFHPLFRHIAKGAYNAGDKYKRRVRDNVLAATKMPKLIWTAPLIKVMTL